ncbi:MAG: ABC transporter ATP-binding protein [Pseudomonadota bacterium]
MSASVELAGACRSYETAAGRFEALCPVDLRFDAGQCVGILGPSGSGKSTLLNLVSGIDRASGGRVAVEGRDITAMGESELAAFRGERIGVVFQFFQLIATLTVAENLRLAMDLVGRIPRRDRDRRSRELLARFDVERHRGKLPAALSGGEQQRVAIARALANDPAVIVADEPTGNLDGANGAVVDGLFSDCASEGRTVLVATHDRSRLDRFDRVLQLEEGSVRSDSARDDTALVEA